jgi:putative methyltransferase (TIGR04325 family)
MTSLTRAKPYIQQITPPILWRMLQSARRKFRASEPSRPRPIVPNAPNISPTPPLGFSGDFLTFEDALLACKAFDKDDNYQNQSIVSSTLERTAVVRDSFLKGTVGPVDVKTLRLLAAIESLLLDSGLKHLTVVDFGGAMGNHFFKIRPVLSKCIALRWIVVDLPRTVEVARGAFNYEGLEYVADVEALKGQSVDLVLASSSVHYTPAPYEFIKKLFNLDPRWFLLDRTPLYQGGRDRIVMQRVPPQIYDAAYPCTFLSDSKLKRFFQENGWETRLSWFLEEEVVPIDGEQVPYQGLLLKKKV